MPKGSLCPLSWSNWGARSSRYAWVQHLLLHGLGGLATRPRPGRPASLSGAQKARLRDLLLAGPEAAGFTSGRWTSGLVQKLVEREFGVLYHVHYLSAVLHGLGFSWQKACFVSDHLDETARTAWLQQQWPALARAASEQGAWLLFADEASVAWWGSLGYTWAPTGQQPRVRTTGRRKGYKVFGLLDYVSGRVFYAGQTGRFTAASYCAFLSSVLAHLEGPVIIVQDGARYHTAKATQEWVAQQGGRVRLVQLPGYSPDYNPIEHVWRYGKEGTHNSYFATFADLEQRVETRLHELQAALAQVQQVMVTPLDAFIGQVAEAA